MTEKILNEISKKLNVLISLYVYQMNDYKEFDNKRKSRQGIGEFARYLSSLGIDTKDIAEILGSPLQSIRTLLTPKRRK